MRSARVVRWALLLAFAYGLVELTSFAGLLLLERVRGVAYRPTDELQRSQRETIQALLAGPPRYIVPDPELGWSLRPGGSVREYRANQAGLRADREFDSIPPANLVRVATFGDSFTHGDDVAYDDTWQALLERMSDDLEVLNFGVPGYGPGQSYLRYQRYREQFSADFVLIGFMSENIYRTVNRFRPFYNDAQGLPFSKPRFTIRGSELQLIPNPLRRSEDYAELLENPRRVLSTLGEGDHHFGSRYFRRRGDWSPTVRLVTVAIQSFTPTAVPDTILIGGRYNTASEAFRVTRAVLGAFYREVTATGAVPIVLIFPRRADVLARRSGRGPQYQPLIDSLERDGHAYLDLYDAFSDAPDVSTLFFDFHYSPDGNRRVAEHILRFLAALSAGA